MWKVCRDSSDFMLLMCQQIYFEGVLGIFGVSAKFEFARKAEGVILLHKDD